MGLSTAVSLRSGSKARRQEVPDGFAILLDSFRGRLDRELAQWIESKRREAAAQGSPEMLELIDALGELLVQGGKRLRPALVYHTYRACGGPSDEEVLPLALATELLHTYLLIHDDIMDHAEVRRGLPAAHARFRDAHRERGFPGDSRDFGNSVAILLGDLAHTWAVELATRAALSGTPRPEIARCFSAMSQEVIGGQYLEMLVAQRRGAPPATPSPDDTMDRPATLAQEREEELTRVLRLKSGCYTAERPIQLGALLAGVSGDRLAELSRYGMAIGEAFQLQDDLLGMFGDAGTVGKPVGADLREGKFTFLIHHALSTASPEQRRLLEHALGNPELGDEEVRQVQRALEETGARGTVERMVEERLQAALQSLERLDDSRSDMEPALQPEGRLFLQGLVDYLWERES